MSGTIVRKWRVWCNVDSKWVYVWDINAPSVCPENNTHAIDTAKTGAIDRVGGEPELNANNQLIVAPTGPKSEDGKQVVVSFPASVDRSIFISSRGDDPSPTAPETGRGNGVPLRITYNAAQTGVLDVSWSYKEVVELFDGEISWKPIDEFDGSDEVTVEVDIPATAPTSTPGSGNVNAVDQGGYDAYVPAPDNDGSHTVNLSDFAQANKAVPVPHPTGAWLFDSYTGALSAAQGNEDLQVPKYHLLSVLVTSYIVRNLSMGNPRGVFELEAQWVQKVHPTWTMKMSVNKVRSPVAACEINGWTQVFRVDTT